MIDHDHKKLSIRAQCRLLRVNRNRLEIARPRISAEDEEVMRQLDVIHTDHPFLGARKLVRE